MKYAFMTFSCPALTLKEVVTLARTYGYSGIEPRIEGNHAHGIELGKSVAELAALGRIATDSGIALCCIATSRVFANPETNAQEIELTRQCIDLAAAVGSTRIRVFGGKIAEGVSREAAIDLLVNALGAVSDHAAQRDVTVCIETHDDWCDPKHLAAVVRQVDHPVIGINWDLAHPVNRAGVSIPDSFRTLSQWIRHCHLHDYTPPGSDGSRTITWIGDGIVDHYEAIRLLHSTGYQGYLSGEWIHRQPGYAEHLPRELETLKRYEQELGV